MLKQIHLITSGLILGWYIFGAASGWKGWAPVISGGSGTSQSGGHGSFFYGGWGGGK